MLVAMLLSVWWVLAVCTRGHWGTTHTQISSVFSPSALSLFSILTADQRQSHSLSEWGVTAQRGCWPGWVCFCYWLNAARAPHTSAATRHQLLPPCAFSLRGGYSHSGVDILTQRWKFSHRGGYSHTEVDILTQGWIFSHRGVYSHTEVDILSQSWIFSILTK